MQASEHIVLEAEIREVPQLQSRRRVHASLQCRSWLRRRTLDLSIIDYHYLGVRLGLRGAVDREYVLDLRFVDPSFALTRQIPWRWIWTALALTVGTGAAVMWYLAETASQSRLMAAEVCATLFAGAALAYLAVAWRLVETVALHSVHGRVALLQYRAGAGTLRRVRPFMRKLGAHVRLAEAARRTTRAEHLRDELREHYRLKEAGVLADETYDASKRRILAQHCSDARRRMEKRAFFSRQPVARQS